MLMVESKIADNLIDWTDKRSSLNLKWEVVGGSAPSHVVNTSLPLSRLASLELQCRQASAAHSRTGLWLELILTEGGWPHCFESVRTRCGGPHLQPTARTADRYPNPVDT
jgi:hypothetical protein